MKQYLHVRAGPYQMLLDAEGVHEIIELSGMDAGTSGHRDWRGHMLSIVNGRTLLGLKDDALPPVHAGVVYSARENVVPVMLELDKVERLQHAEEGSLLGLPSVPERVFSLFDGVLCDRNVGVQLYHLRRPLDVEVLSSLLVADSASDEMAGQEQPAFQGQIIEDVQSLHESAKATGDVSRARKRSSRRKKKSD